ncbi:SpoIID/LytB domain-containing protein [Papillibacter cinnamivorans]|uniref:Stage II sporulation protein D n=1 Tax=Papillibacter cinnamivorans DSM 12816 TaxID=1122930 RepID=A0A1W2CIL1_9FIRM|nr:SpoIID/LytB domain-containing protein [Papillibacter cinnamivorans]SMC84468.1 stage II sporulation protein D [Papillibacter cinnamivorans DSM 12816]
MRKFVQIAAAVGAILACLTVSAAAVDDNPTVKVGLYYGSSALFSANLQNFAGSGYQFGYYDSGRNFVSLGSTAETKISMTCDTNIYVSGGTYYDTVPTYSYSVIGAYHIQLPQVYGTFAEAQQAAAAITAVPAFPAYVSGSFYVRAGNYQTADAANAAMLSLGVTGGTAVGNSSTGITVTRTTTTTILFEYDGGGNTQLAVLPNLDSSVKAVTWFKNIKYYGGFEYRRVSGGYITVINVLPMQDYIKGVIPYEMSPSWPLEALKAQAVCARTYAVKSNSKHAKDGFDLCNTTDCQVYKGTNSANAVTDQAVDETCGMFVCYGGSLAETVYFSCDGGATEDVQNVWGTSYPYLMGVEDPFEPVEKISGYYWNVTYTLDQLTALLKEKGYTTGNITDVYVSEYTAMGNVLSVTFRDDWGKSYTFYRSGAKSIFYSSSLGKSLSSQRFSIAPADGSVTLYVNGGTDTLGTVAETYALRGDGTVGKLSGSGSSTYVLSSTGLSTLYTQGTARSFTVSGTGKGHNVGMSQWGAYGMASQGYTYDQIIGYYYSGVNLD